MEFYKSEEEYLSELQKRSKLPGGFSTATASLKFFPKKKPVNKKLAMNLTFIAMENPTELFGAVYTKNAFLGAPVVVGKERFNNRTIRGILINNKIANVSAPEV